MSKSEQNVEPYRNPQTYVEGLGDVYCGLPRSRKCPRHPRGFKFAGKKKCKGCRNAQYRKGTE